MSDMNQPAEVPIDREPAVLPPPPDSPTSDSPTQDSQSRLRRLQRGADDLRTRRDSFFERTGVLLIASAVLVTLGLSLIVIGWSGTSGSIHVEEQIPYVVSGGILGATLAIIGAFCLFTHWLTVGIRESRAREERAEQRHAELLAALSGSEWKVVDDYAKGGGDNGRSDRGRRERPLRPTSRGS